MTDAPVAPADDLAALKKEIDSFTWFHQIDFGHGILSPGWIKLPKIARNAEIVFGRAPVAGRSVLDVGCWDGAYSVEALRRGASRVLSTDHYVWHNGWDRRAFDIVRGRLAPSLEVMDIDVQDLSVERVGLFDVVLFLGVFYHLRHPYAVLERLAKIAKECLIVETRLLRTLSQQPIMRFYPGSELDGDPTNWWAPNRACVEAMLRELGFKKILFKHPDWRWRRGIFHAFR